MSSAILASQLLFLQLFSRSFTNYFWITIAIIFVIVILRQYSRIKEVSNHSNWSVLVEGFKINPQAFYNQLGDELRSKEIRELEYTVEKISSGGVFSRSRLYMRIRRNDYIYDISCFPIGNGMFFSWWLYPDIRGLERVLYFIPWLGPVVAKLLFPMTYYRRDTTSAYMTFVHQCMLATIEDVTKEKGYRVPENQRTPNISEALKR